MTAERTAEEWGRVAVSLPGFRPGGMVGTIDTPDGEVGFGLDGMIWRRPHSDGIRPPWVLDVDHPATAGCLFALLGVDRDSLMLLPNEDGLFEWYNGEYFDEQSLPFGRACIAAAEALGRWPGGAE